MVSEDSYRKARETFTNFPEDVFTLWLDDRIQSNGWPPRGIEWQGFLFGYSLEFWQGLVWSKRRLPVRAEDLAEKSWNLLYELLEANVKGKRNLVAQYIPDTRDRFSSALTYLTENQDLPGTPILLEVNCEYEIVDGAHRMAALTFASHKPEFAPYVPADIEAWVAAPPT